MGIRDEYSLQELKSKIHLFQEGGMTLAHHFPNGNQMLITSQYLDEAFYDGHALRFRRSDLNTGEIIYDEKYPLTQDTNSIGYKEKKDLLLIAFEHQKMIMHEKHREENLAIAKKEHEKRERLTRILYEQLDN